jgi:hypothetical protein
LKSKKLKKKQRRNKLKRPKLLKKRSRLTAPMKISPKMSK